MLIRGPGANDVDGQADGHCGHCHGVKVRQLGKKGVGRLGGGVAGGGG